MAELTEVWDSLSWKLTCDKWDRNKLGRVWIKTFDGIFALLQNFNYFFWSGIYLLRQKFMWQKLLSPKEKTGKILPFEDVYLLFLVEAKR